MGKRKIGGIYLASEHYDEDAGKTVGKSLAGAEFTQVLANRRTIMGKPTAQAQKIMQKFLDKLQATLDCGKLTIKFSRYCGCSMCPCSPGYVVYEEVEGRATKMKADLLFACFLEGAGYEFRAPTNMYYKDRYKKMKSLKRA